MPSSRGRKLLYLSSLKILALASSEGLLLSKEELFLSVPDNRPMPPPPEPTYLEAEYGYY
jgi:hypothetical protein